MSAMQYLDAATNVDHEIGFGRTVVNSWLEVTVAASPLAATGETPWDSTTTIYISMSLAAAGAADDLRAAQPEVTIGYYIHWW